MNAKKIVDLSSGQWATHRTETAKTVVIIDAYDPGCDGPDTGYIGFLVELLRSYRSDLRFKRAQLNRARAEGADDLELLNDISSLESEAEKICAKIDAEAGV